MASSKHKSVRVHLRIIFQQNIDVEFSVTTLADMVERSRGMSTDITNIYSAIKALRDKDGMTIVLVRMRTYKYTGDQ